MSRARVVPIYVHGRVFMWFGSYDYANGIRVTWWGSRQAAFAELSRVFRVSS